ncbi:hypothetical protein DJ535_01365 [Citrobacter murliniae]|uniref:Uncharacterized protein n=1 Tax=Citrobacter murliniae TaxID=67829 RepID=A0ABY2PZJ6_9ENTR|nr:hypothetical protein DJ535_01365 [Citrobacter murliniae]
MGSDQNPHLLCISSCFSALSVPRLAVTRTPEGPDSKCCLMDNRLRSAKLACMCPEFWGN